jgi:hypothetical protein
MSSRSTAAHRRLKKPPIAAKSHRFPGDDNRMIRFLAFLHAGMERKADDSIMMT